MKKSKLLITFLLVMLGVVLMSFTASAETYSGECGAEGDNVTWTLDTQTGVLEISGTGAMKDCDDSLWGDYRLSVKSVVISEGVTRIGNNAFYYPTSVSEDGVVEPCFAITSIIIPDSVIAIGDCAFYNCKNLVSVTIPNSVATFGYGVFGECTALTSVTIPDGITTLDTYTFIGCTSLTDVKIGKSVTTIGYAAFGFCESLTSITISDSVTNIASYAFSACTGLKDVYYYGSEEDWNRITIEEYNDCLLNANIHYINDENAECENHTDSNQDGICDDCNFDKTKDCKCRCHKTDFFSKIIWFFQKLFGAGKKPCACGKAH